MSFETDPFLVRVRLPVRRYTQLGPAAAAVHDSASAKFPLVSRKPELAAVIRNGSYPAFLFAHHAVLIRRLPKQQVKLRARETDGRLAQRHSCSLSGHVQTHFRYADRGIQRPRVRS